MDKVIVTGSDGFIGKILVASLRELKFEVIEISRKSGDITDELLWKGLPKSDVVIHLAGASNIPESWLKPSKFVNVNVGGTIKVLEYCASHNARIIFAGTYIYGIPKELPVKESHQKNPNNPYAFSKYLAEESCKFYSDHMDVKVTILRFFNIYGAGQGENFLIPSIIGQIKQDNGIILNDLEPKRDYLYVHDAVSAIIKSIPLRKGFSVINIGSGVSYSVKKVVEVIQKKMDTSLSIAENKVKRKNEIENVVADISYAKIVLDWEPKYKFDEGVGEMLLHMRD